MSELFSGYKSSKTKAAQIISWARCAGAPVLLKNKELTGDVTYVRQHTLQQKNVTVV